MTKTNLVAAALALSLCGAARGQEPASGARDPGRTIYLALCASCHGPEGKGDGPVRVDPPPRDLTSGRFSFGNTEDAVFNTVTGGIPPIMPPFEGTLDEAQRRAVARYVLSLAPTPVAAAPTASRMEIGSEAVVVRGYLPPRREGDEPLPRGLVIGLPGGVSLLWNADDLRLLELRRGGLVDRTDWSGRGGTPLEPLAEEMVDFGIDPAPMFRTADGPLAAELVETTVDGDAAVLRYRLLDARHRVAVDVEERVTLCTLPGALGAKRRFEVEARRPIDLTVEAPTPIGRPLPGPPPGGSATVAGYRVAPGDPLPAACVAVAAQSPAVLGGSPITARLELVPGTPRELGIVVARTREPGGSGPGPRDPASPYSALCEEAGR